MIKKRFPILFCILTLFYLTVHLRTVSAQTSPVSGVPENGGSEDCRISEAGDVRICKFDYQYKGQTVEALTFRPNKDGKFPALLLIPGYSGTAKTYLNIAGIFANAGFASISVGTPGFGKTELKPDYLGEETIKAYIAGLKKFKKEPFVDKSKTGVFGYSRGAIAAALLIEQVGDVKATVLGGGIYDVKKAYQDLTIEGIRENIKIETGLDESTLKKRSAAFGVNKIKCPVLILHGENDLNAPTNQVFLLRDKLEEAGKDYEFQILTGHTHGRLGGDFLTLTIDFYSRKLRGYPSSFKIR